MKCFLAIVLCAVAVAAVSNFDPAASITNSTETKDVNITRQKRTLGVHKTFEKEVTIQTITGGSIKISKKIDYNDGGALKMLPNLLEAKTNNVIRLINSLHGKKYPKGASQLDNVGDQVSANADSEISIKK